jgi:signal transduction histidine kinase
LLPLIDVCPAHYAIVRTMLHSQTTLILAALLFLVLPLLMWWATAGQRSAAMAWWCMGSLVMGTGIVLMGVRPWIPSWLSYHGANTALLAGMGFWAQSLRVMQGRGIPHGWVAAAVLLALLYYSVLFIWFEPHVRGMGIRVVLGALALYTAWQAWRLPQRLLSHNASAIALSYLALGLGLWIQSMYVGINKDPSPFSNSWDASVIALLALATSAVGHLCFTGMVLDGATRERVRAARSRTSAEESTRLDRQLRLLDRQYRMLLVSGSMTHELGQPLRLALSEAQQAKRSLLAGEADATFLTRALERMAWSMRQASDMLDRIRVSARTHGSMRMDRLDLREVLQATTGLLSAEWQHLGVQVETELGDEPLWCQGDEVALSQVLVNLLRNATLAAEAAPRRRLQLLTRGSGHEVMAVIRDHGPGDAHQALSHPDAHAAEAQEQDPDMSLAIARTIAQQHGGRLSLQAHPAGGTEAVLVLPRAPREAA